MAKLDALTLKIKIGTITKILLSKFIIGLTIGIGLAVGLGVTLELIFSLCS